jgi:hypothetical protein
MKSAAAQVRNCIGFSGKTAAGWRLHALNFPGVLWSSRVQVSFEGQVMTFRRNLRPPSSRKIRVNSCRKILVHYLDPSTQENVTGILLCRTCRCWKERRLV